MPVNYREWNEIQSKVAAMLGQRGESFSLGKVTRNDADRKLVWVQGFGPEPIPFIAFQGNINIYDEWAIPSFQFTKYDVAGNYTYTSPGGVILLEIDCIGGGGGSGGSGASGLVTSTTGGGGGGSWGHKLLQGVLSATYPVTVGQGGIAGTTTPTDGGQAGDTVFGPTPECKGIGGKGSVFVNAGQTRIGAAAGSGGVGDFCIDGNPGEAGDTDSQGGNGGSSGYGGGGGKGANGAGGAGAGFGGGAGGVRGISKAGAAGHDGACLIKATVMTTIVKKKNAIMTPNIPEVGDVVLIAQHMGTSELPYCLGTLESFGFQNYDAGLE